MLISYVKSSAVSVQLLSIQSVPVLEPHLCTISLHEFTLNVTYQIRVYINCFIWIYGEILYSKLFITDTNIFH